MKDAGAPKHVHYHYRPELLRVTLKVDVNIRINETNEILKNKSKKYHRPFSQSVVSNSEAW